MSARIEAVLFDLGGVLIELVGVERMLQWCPALGDTETLWRRWLDSPTVRRYESGKITRGEFAKSLIEKFALPVEPDAFLTEFAGWPRRLYDDAATLLAELKPRFRLASLSNTNELHWERFSREWDLPSHFHANFPSHAVGRARSRDARRRARVRAVRRRGERRGSSAARHRRAPRDRPAGRAQRSRRIEARRTRL
jgi:FMN phosphatase YigB (HAD superfamily)